MEKNIVHQEVTFTHAVLEGTHYEVGKKQGEWLKNIPGYVQFMTSKIEGLPVMAEDELDKAIRFIDRYCPGLNEEIQGFADALGVSPKQVVFYAMTCQITGQCSQFAVLPEITQDGHFYVGRSYEWSDEDELRLCTTRVNGKAAHIGFSIFQFGRFDGFNEHGLTVTMSAGVPGSSPNNEGLKFWAVIRTLLDRCRNVDEALALVSEIPMAFNWNLILADRTNQAALVEIACNHHSIKRIHTETCDKYVCATNHYTLPDMKQFDTNRLWQSAARYQAIQNGISAAAPQVSRESMLKILTSSVPQGVCCHYYKDWLGTLWSMIFDVTAGTVDICFGSPQVNPWRTFGLWDEAGIKAYMAIFPNEQVSNPELFYRRLDPGGDLI